MPSIAGFYASHETCREWLRRHRPDQYAEYPMAGAKQVCVEMRSLMREKSLDWILEMDFFPDPEPRKIVDRCKTCLVAVSRNDNRKIYIPHEGERRSLDLKAKACIEEEIGLKMSDWMVLLKWTND
ncbi:hypothetical protein BDV93DRAFT_522451 [Ceratobasidium sp. AG-I]|nr:hypothetical protein BDV93DRAFT_522451 [Ceratobasidium sp. AG-I]